MSDDAVLGAAVDDRPSAADRILEAEKILVISEPAVRQRLSRSRAAVRGAMVMAVLVTL